MAKTRLLMGVGSPEREYLKEYDCTLHQTLLMPSIFDNPAIRYGISLINATIIAIIAFTLLEGTIRWVALGIAALEVIVTPQILKHAE